jgi:mannose-6-phosphate isomerase-like protein (cupin superfamily)
VKESIALMNSSTIHLASGEGSKSLWVLGELVTYKVTAEQTGGAYSLFEVVTRPGGGPSPHVQHQEDECFYVLEGEFEFLNNGDVVGVGAGSLVYVPRGNLHTYKNVGSEPGRMLVSQTPGGLHERFFEELGEEAKGLPALPTPEGPANIQSIVMTAAKYGIEMPPPPAS